MSTFERYTKKISRVFYLDYLIPVLFLIALAEAVFYDGIVEKFFLIDVKLLLALAIILLAIVNPSHRNNPDVQYIFRFNRLIVLPVLTAIFLVFNVVEAHHSMGYMFNYLHIHTQSLVLALFFSWLLLSIERSKFVIKDWTTALGIVLVLFALFSNLLYSSWILSQKLMYSFSPTMASYDQRMHAVWGYFYTYTQFVNAETVQNSRILHPPQENPWQMVGNQLVLRYFTYPRILNQAPDGNVAKLARNVDYVLITQGEPNLYHTEELEGWPYENFAYESILLAQASKISLTVQAISGLPENMMDTINQTYTVEDQFLVDQEVWRYPIDQINSESILVELEANDRYAAKLVVMGKNVRGEDVNLSGTSGWHESETEISDVGILSLDLHIPSIAKRMQIFNATPESVALVVTNRKPMPYLYRYGIARVATDSPTLAHISTQSYTAWGNYLYMTEDYSGAIDVYNKALLLDSENVESYMGLYYSYSHLGQNAMAEEALINAQKYLPTERPLNVASVLLPDNINP